MNTREAAINEELRAGFIRASHLLEETRSTLAIDPILVELGELTTDEAGEEAAKAALTWAFHSWRGFGMAEIIQYFGHRFKWQWLRQQVEEAFAASTEAHDLRSMRFYEYILEAFNENWEDVDFFPSLERNTPMN